MFKFGDIVSYMTDWGELIGTVINFNEHSCLVEWSDESTTWIKNRFLKRTRY